MVSLLQIIKYAINIYVVLLIAMAVMSWLISFDVLNRRNRTVSQIAYFLYRITDPPLRPLRRIIPNFGGIDITPVILILIFQFILIVIDNNMYRFV